jgi:hypothetical protein
MTYAIKQFNPATGQITVEFDPMVGVFSIDVPLTQAGLYITGEELDTYIKGFEPKDFINRGKQIAVGIANSAEIAALAESVYAAHTQNDEEVAQAAAEQAKAAEMEKYVKAGLIKYGLITE